MKMNNYKKLICKIAAVAFLPGMMGLTSCSEDIDESNLYTFTGETIEDYLANRPDQFSSFNYILQRAGLDKLMSGYGTYTCFAPTNEAVEEYIDSLYNDPENKELPQEAKIDLIVALITLKYTQSNSVCYAYDGQAIGVGAGQQSRIHCTRLAGTKADTWFLRQHPKTLALPFRPGMGRADRDNVIDSYINGNEEDVCAEGIWQNYFTEQPAPLTAGEKEAFLAAQANVALGSDAFFPFSDNIKRAAKSGVKYIAEPGGSIRDDAVIDECNRRGMVMAFTGMRLFHH